MTTTPHAVGSIPCYQGESATSRMGFEVAGYAPNAQSASTLAA